MNDLPQRSQRTQREPCDGEREESEPSVSSVTSVAGAGGGIRIEKLSFRIGEFELKDVSLEVAEGEYFVLTGPNGAGKTMLMRLIAGLEAPCAGEIFIAGERATPVPPWERPIGYVPQDVALFPHRNVERNVAFGLEVRKLDSLLGRQLKALATPVTGTAAEPPKQAFVPQVVPADGDLPGDDIPF